MRYFQNIRTLDELKAAYRRLAMQHHPDRGGDVETMKAINAEHDELFEILKRQHNETHDENHQTTETPEEFRTIIEILLRLDGLEVELCGSWLWIGGETRKHKEILKAAGCRWSNNKKLWYWRHPEDGCYRRGAKSKTMNAIRAKYGSQTFRAGRENTFDAIEATA
jgi:curved DNA-binding protein CbpA